MANYTALKAAIADAIKTNGQEYITGQVLQEILLSLVETIGESSTNGVDGVQDDLAAEVTARSNADLELDGKITAEKGAREDADTLLQGNIDAEALRAAMAEASLDGRLDIIEGEIPEAASSSNKLTDKAYVDAADTELDGRLDTIEGEIPSEASSSNKLADKAFVTTITNALQTAVNGIKSNIDNGYVYVGIASPMGVPVSGKVFYLATTAGTYTNFGGLAITQGINILKYNGTNWSSEQLVGIDDIPVENSQKMVKSGGVYEEFRKRDEQIDISIQTKYSVAVIDDDEKIIESEIADIFYGLTRGEYNLELNEYTLSPYEYTLKLYNTKYAFALLDVNDRMVASALNSALYGMNEPDLSHVESGLLNLYADVDKLYETRKCDDIEIDISGHSVVICDKNMVPISLI